MREQVLVYPPLKGPEIGLQIDSPAPLNQLFAQDLGLRFRCVRN